MFRRRNPSSEESIFKIDQNKVKRKINQNLAHIIKELQKEYPISSSPVQSESSLAQHLCSVVESAFIHGLKNSCYEKDSTKSTSKNSFPKPQFWNLILKISHAETINRVQALPYILTKVGKCRAWLRLTLNDSAVTSYLSSILSKDQKSTLSNYYENHALFLDQEHAEIFLRYLQGVESVIFDLSYNSSMLNQWTKTPLELAGLVPPSTTAPLYLGIQASAENNNFPKRNANGRLASHRASAPAAVLRQQIFSKSLPPTSGDQWLKNHQPENGSIGKENSPRLKRSDVIHEEDEDTVDSATPVSTPADTDDILHKRQLIKKNKRRKKLSKGLRGSWSSISSGEGSATSGSTAGVRTPRSRSFCETPPTTVLPKKAGELAERKAMSRIKKGLPSSPKSHRHISVEDEVFKPNHKSSYPLKNKNLDLTPKREKKISTSSDKSDYLELFPPDVSIDQGSSTPSSSGLEDSTGSQGGTIDSKLNSQMPLPVTYQISFVTSSESISGNDDSRADEKGQQTAKKVDEGQSLTVTGQTTATEIPDVMLKSTDSIDIYATSIKEREEGKLPNSSNSSLDLSASGRVGNSLSRGGGWSAPNTPDYQDSTQKNGRNTIFGSISGQNNETRMIEESHESPKWASSRDLKLPNNEEVTIETPQNEIFIRREGYLRKLGEKLKLWKQRWFVLRGTTLNYYKDKNSDLVLGTIDLTDVLTISEETFEKDADIVIVMNDGSEHHLAAEKKKVTLDWAADFLQVLAGPESPQKGDLEQSGEDIYTKNYLDEYEVISVRNQHLSGTKTSWHALMMVHMGKIANEKGLDAQNYQCADCASPFILFGAARVCTFTGQYYCSQCHNNEESQIPARIIHNWDFRKHKVAKRSKTFIEQFFDQPVINLSESNPGIYKYIDEMGKISHLRQQLVHLKPYLQTCRRFDMDGIILKLGSRQHFLEDPHIYSVQDICNVHDKSLGNLLTKLVSSGTKHVYGCPLCSAKGFLCEICQNDKIIFPFETESTVQCDDCKSVFHRGCKNEDCPKCERRRLRIMKSTEYIKDISDSETDEY